MLARPRFEKLLGMMNVKSLDTSNLVEKKCEKQVGAIHQGGAVSNLMPALLGACVAFQQAVVAESRKQVGGLDSWANIGRTYSWERVNEWLEENFMSIVFQAVCVYTVVVVVLKILA